MIRAIDNDRLCDWAHTDSGQVQPQHFLVAGAVIVVPVDPLAVEVGDVLEVGSKSGQAA